MTDQETDDHPTEFGTVVTVSKFLVESDGWDLVDDKIVAVTHLQHKVPEDVSITVEGRSALRFEEDEAGTPVTVYLPEDSPQVEFYACWLRWEIPND